MRHTRRHLIGDRLKALDQMQMPIGWTWNENDSTAESMSNLFDITQLWIPELLGTAAADHVPP